MSVKPLGELNPDYVLLVAFPQQGGEATAQAQKDVSKLVDQLSKTGFYTQVRPADDDQLLLFVKASDAVLLQHLKTEGVKEYLYGVRGELDSDDSLVSQLTNTTKLNAVYSLLTDPVKEGGAGITTGSTEWSFVKKISPIWDYDDNKRLLKSFLKLSFDEIDVEKIRVVAGEKVALYFAFVRLYFLALFIPAALGLVSHLFFKRYSLVYTVLNSIWAIVFLAAWRKKQSLYALQWKTTGSSKVEIRRSEFVGESTEIDPATGASVPSFDPAKRTARQIAFLPIALGGVAMLVSYQFSCFFIEIFLTEIYQGAGKAILGLVPTILIVGFVPILTAIYEKIVDKALEYENHEYQSSYNRSKLQKMYLYNFLSAYVPLFITVFFYLPFGHNVNQYVPSIAAYSSRVGIPVVQDHYQINNDRLTTQFAYFTLTAQIVSFLTENIVPVVLRLAKEKMGAGKAVVKHLDSTEETAYLSNVRQQLAMPEFDVDAEYRELTMQFGYLVLFGPVWSLAPLISLIFNWIEIRGDAEKLLFECSRPVPRQEETIKPWDTHIRILTWLGSFTGPLVTVMYRRHSEVLASSSYSFSASPIVTPGWKLATTALIAENVALGVNFAVESIFQSSITSIEKEHFERELLMRRSYVDAYSKNVSLSKRDLDIDPSTSTWRQFSSSNVVKAAVGFPALIAAAKAATAKSKEAEKKTTKTSSSDVNTAADSVPLSEKSGFKQHKSGELRSTTASKTTPKTAEPFSSETRDIPATTFAANTAGSGPALTSSATVPSSTSRSGEAALVGGGLAAGIASAVGVKSSEAPAPTSVRSDASVKTSTSTVASDRAAVGIPVPDPSVPAPEETSTKKKRGLFGFSKKDAKSIGKAAQIDAAKAAPDLKTVGADVAKGDFSSAKKIATDVKANPDKFIGNTKKALNGAETRDVTSGFNGPSAVPNNTSSSAPTAPLPTAPSPSSSNNTETPGLGAAAIGVAGTAAAATGISQSKSRDTSASTPPASTGSQTSEPTSTPSASRSKSIFRMGKKKERPVSGVPAASASSSVPKVPTAPTESSGISSATAGLGSAAATGATAIGLSSKDSKSSLKAAPSATSASAPLDKSATTQPVDETFISDSSTPSRSRGLFGLHKKDVTSFGKAAKADATKLTPDAKKIAADLKRGDFTSAKKFASDVKANPNEYFGNSKQAYESSRHGEAAIASGSAAGASSSLPSSADASADVPSSSGAVTGSVPSTSVNASGSVIPTSSDADISKGSAPSSSDSTTGTGIGSIGTAGAAVVAVGAAGAAAIGLAKGSQAPAASGTGISESIGSAAAGIASSVGLGQSAPVSSGSGLGGSLGGAAAGVAAVGVAGAAAIGLSGSKGSNETDSVPTASDPIEETVTTSAKDDTPETTTGTATPSKTGFFGWGKKDGTVTDSVSGSHPSTTADISEDVSASGPVTSDATTSAPSSGITGSLGSIAAGAAATVGAGAAAVGLTGSKDSKTADSAPSSSSAADVSTPVSESSGTSTPSKSKGIFGWGKKDVTSFATAAKADLTKLTPDAKKIAGDLKNGDFSSAKKFASDLKANPNEYFGNTKEAYQHHSQGETTSSSVSGSHPSGSVPAATLSETKSSGKAADLTAASSGSVSGSADTGIDAVVGAIGANAAAGSAPLSGSPPSSATADSTVASKTQVPHVSAPADSPGSDIPESSSKAGSTGLAAGLGLGAVAGAFGLGSTADKGASTPSSSGSNSLAGATLPPQFEKKASSTENRSPPVPNDAGVSAQQTGYTGSSADAFAGQPDEAITNLKTNAPSGASHTLDPKIAATPATPTSASAQYTQPSASASSQAPMGEASTASSSSNLKNGAVLGGATAGLAAAGATLSSKFTSSNKGSSQKITSNLTETDGTSGSFFGAAKGYTEKGGKSLNDYVQLAADKIDNYAKKSDNEYLNKGNVYVQKLADGVEDYTQKDGATSTTGTTSAVPTTPKQSSGSQFVKSETPKTSEAGSGTLPSQFVENTNPFSGETGTVTATGDISGDALAPPKLMTADDTYSQSSSTASSPSKKKKRGLLSKIKEKVSNSPSSTPKKH